MLSPRDHAEPGLAPSGARGDWCGEGAISVALWQGCQEGNHRVCQSGAVAVGCLASRGAAYRLPFAQQRSNRPASATQPPQPSTSS